MAMPWNVRARDVDSRRFRFRVFACSDAGNPPATDGRDRWCGILKDVEYITLWIEFRDPTGLGFINNQVGFTFMAEST